MLRKRINLIKGQSIAKPLTASGKKGAGAKKARFNFEAPAEGKQKAPNGTNGHTTTNGKHPAPAANELHAGLVAANVTVDSPLIVEKIKELLRLGQDQGYLTYDDINDALPDEVVTPEVLDAIYSKLRGFEVEIVEAPDLDRPKPAEPAEEEEESRLDILDDPVQMYLRQMGKVPRTGSGDLQAHRRRRDGGPPHSFWLRFYGQRACCLGRETSVGPAARTF
jgi:RNA polymerase primary sigma factor